MLVPLDPRPESFGALEIACRLAADTHAKITAIAVIEVPALLPLDAHLSDEEEQARRLLERAGATGDSYGVRVVPKVVRGRDAAAAIVEQVASDGAELVVIGAPRAELAESPRHLAPSTLLRVLKGARCRVMLVSSPAREAA